MIDRSKNLCAYDRNDVQDGHGGRAEAHKAEMREIAEEIAVAKINELVPQMAVELYNNCLTRLYDGLTRDVETIVSVSINDAGEILKSNKLSTVLTDNIRRSILANIGDISLKI